MIVGQPSNQVWKYEQKFDRWSHLRDMLTPRSELGLALIDGYIYACGGTDGEARLNSIERYSISENKWSLVCIEVNRMIIDRWIISLDCDNASGHDQSSLLCTEWIFVYNRWDTRRKKLILKG